MTTYIPFTGDMNANTAAINANIGNILSGKTGVSVNYPGSGIKMTFLGDKITSTVNSTRSSSTEVFSYTVTDAKGIFGSNAVFRLSEQMDAAGHLTTSGVLDVTIAASQLARSAAAFGTFMKQMGFSAALPAPVPVPGHPGQSSVSAVVSGSQIGLTLTTTASNVAIHGTFLTRT